MFLFSLVMILVSLLNVFLAGADAVDSGVGDHLS